MTESKKNTYPASTSLQNAPKVLQVVVVIYMVIVLAAMLAQILVSGPWLNVPFIGAFVEPTMVFNGNDSIEQPSSWSAIQQGIVSRDQLLAVDGQPVYTARTLQSFLQGKSVGDTVDLSVKHENGATEKISVTLTSLPQIDRITYFYVPYVIGWIYFLAAVWVFFVQRHEAAGRTFAIVLSSVALAASCMFDLYTSHLTASLWVFSLPLVAASLINLAVLFPHPEPVLKRHPWLEGIPYAVALLLGGLAALFLNDMAHPMRYMPVMTAIYIFTALALIFSAFWFLFRRLPNTAAMEREQIRLLILGGVFAFAPIAVRLIGSMIWVENASFSPLFMLPLLIFPLMAAYAVRRYHMVSVSYFLSRIFLYGLMGVLVSVGYALLLTGLGVAMTGILPRQSPILVGLLFFLAAIAINPFRQKMENLMDAVFFRGEKAYQERVQTFSGELTGVAAIEGIIKLLRQYVQRSLLPESFHIFIFDPLVEQYVATPNAQNVMTSDLRFPDRSALVTTLEKRKTCIYLDPSQPLPDDFQGDDARLRLLASSVFVPMMGNQRLAGWLALGERASGEQYALRDFKFLKSISNQAALAIERAQVVANMKSACAR